MVRDMGHPILYGISNVRSNDFPLVLVYGTLEKTQIPCPQCDVSLCPVCARWIMFWQWKYSEIRKSRRRVAVRGGNCLKNSQRQTQNDTISPEMNGGFSKIGSREESDGSPLGSQQRTKGRTIGAPKSAPSWCAAMSESDLDFQVDWE